MKELSLHVLDLVQNSIRAQASCIEIRIEEQVALNQLIISIKDNGKGIEESLLKNITNPFVTTRTLRKVGLGIPFVAKMCEECEGSFDILSQVGAGTEVEMKFKYNHIDLLPLGNMAETLVTLVMAKSSIRFVYKHYYENNFFEVDTDEIKKLLDGVPIDNFEILEWLKNYINEGVVALKIER